jgi:uncharacterized protein
MNKHHTLNYIEFTANNLKEIKEFYSTSFDWKFTDFGPDYTAFKDEVLEGGFSKGKVIKGGPLVIFYSNNLEDSLRIITQNGGTISKNIYSFPGGRRFHFTDPAGNQLAIWSDIKKK